MIALTFALPDESRDVRARLQRHRREEAAGDDDTAHAHGTVGRFGGAVVIVAHTGVGASALCRARVQALLAHEKPTLVIASGYAGGLHADLRIGDLVIGENVSDPSLAQIARDALAAAGFTEAGYSGRGTLTTAPRTVETAADKRALAAASGAIAVDMETGWIADACRAAGVPLLALRVISDDARTDFPVPASVMFDQVKQRPRLVALPLWLLAHPARIAPFVRFVRGLAPARRRLTDALEKVVAALGTTEKVSADFADERR